MQALSEGEFSHLITSSPNDISLSNAGVDENVGNRRRDPRGYRSGCGQHVHV